MSLIILGTHETRQLAGVIASAPKGCRIAMDTETTGLRPYGEDHLTGISICLIPSSSDREGNGYYIPVNHKTNNVEPGAVRNLLDALSTTEAQHLGHHLVFDWAFLERLDMGYTVPDRDQIQQGLVRDSQVVRWLQDENMPKGLKTLGDQFLGYDASAEQRALKELMAPRFRTITEARKEVKAAFGTSRSKEEREALAQSGRVGKSWGDLTPDEIGEYAALDAQITAQLDVRLESSKQTGLVREMEVQRIIYEMNKKGISVDPGALLEAGARYRQRSEEIKADLKNEHGLENPGSGPQVAHLLYDQLGIRVPMVTKGGAPSTGKNALEQLEGHPVAAKVLEYRRMVKADTAYCQPFAESALASPSGWRVHTHYASTQTVTGRLSASGPNVMTIPRGDSLPEVREAFYATDPGVIRVAFDLASAELWVTAHVTQDPVLMSVLMEGRNLHQEMSLQVFGTDDKKSKFYTLSKNVNYGIEYGAGLDQITLFAAKAGFSPEEARKVAKIARDGHKALFKRQHAVAEALAHKAEERGLLPLHVPGRYRHFHSPGKRVPYYTALNALVQGGVAEYMKDVMIEVWNRGFGRHLVLQVHDELVFDCAPSEAADIEHALNEIARDINPFHRIPPIRWDAKQWSYE